MSDFTLSIVIVATLVVGWAIAEISTELRFRRDMRRK